MYAYQPDMESPRFTVPRDVKAELLMIGSRSSTYRLGQVVVKVPRIDTEAEITQGNAKATAIEANVYKILGTHDRIANCLYISPTKDMIMLDFYQYGNLKDYVAYHGPTQLRKWAKQMIEAVQLVHSKGVRHSDIRLDQWLLDSEMNARLSDFNASGYDECPAFGLHGEKAIGDEAPSHFMPRNSSGDNSIRSDLLALGSALYEIEQGSSPFAGADDETITRRFALREFPSVSKLTLGCIILGAWEVLYPGTAVVALRMWNVRTVTESDGIELDGRPSSVTFSQDGKSLAIGFEEGRAELWDAIGRPTDNAALYTDLRSMYRRT
ncbi:hypothetical protein EJ03DRAFT_374689 [Teratosphaeria nubilosa]|uniref:non-specific serine/threonine protein kinase n=1 Tax=Teratosphaeria nubilosa TaxID=161662 RepID=A0A6G1L9B4_9PEZI|nr:hypothetical protein EJ03DRAFT_374689 [Teratosphaeria nubilosa]